MTRLSAEELRAAQSAQNWGLLWKEAIPLVKHAIKKLRRKGLSQQDRDDLFQEGNLAAGDAVRSWNPDAGAFSTWVIFRVNGALRNHLARVAHGILGTRETHVPTAAFALDHFASSNKQYAAVLEEEQVAQAVRDAVGKLPEIEAMVVRARYGIDCEPSPADEVAAVHGVPARRQLRIITRALKKLSDLVASPGYLGPNGIGNKQHVNEGSISGTVRGVEYQAPQLADDVQ
jgi:RNA polymerase sigma factor (sigma-70 family)